MKKKFVFRRLGIIYICTHCTQLTLQNLHVVYFDRIEKQRRTVNTTISVCLSVRVNNLVPVIPRFISNYRPHVHKF